MGANCWTDGKRTIHLSIDPQDLPIQLPTGLHEIRELLEYCFVKLGRPITNSGADNEIRTDGFAASVMEFSGIKLVCDQVENPLEVEKVLRSSGDFALFGIIALALITGAHLTRTCSKDSFGATYPHCRDGKPEGQS
jgi:hypothetical protein